METTEIELWRRVNSVLLQALERAPGEQQEFLDRACGDDDNLRREVDSLLAAGTDAGHPIDRPAFDLLSSSPAILKAGERIGCYRIVREIGRGGTGAVYLATSTDGEPRQKVAIKVLKRGMDTDEIVRGFRQERRILANLDHPAIARLHDSGVTPDHRLYLVMEYVDGEPVDRYCGARSLGVRERLELFLEVCAAVQLAHQNLVIHRDLKPSNILVTADGEPKLLDFGIAKLLHPDGAGPQAVTAAAWRLMTPGYASPEQVMGRPMTTASDVYSLGVVLYELLTGRRPYRIDSSLETDVRQVICHSRPLKPSLAVVRRRPSSGPEVPHSNVTASGKTTAGEAASGERPAGERPSDPLRGSRGNGRRLQRRLAGDLDNIVLMALRKRPQRRYASADQLAGDLRRHLDGLPVSARRATWGYRAGKFLHRSRRAAALAAVFILLLLGFAVDRELQQRRIAREHERARQVSEFWSELFDLEAEDIDKPRSRLTARDLLDRGAARIEELRAQPRLQADLMTVIGQGYMSLGWCEAAAPLFERALALRRKFHGNLHLEVAESLDALAGLEIAMGRYRRAEALGRESLEIYRRLLGEDHPTVVRARHAVAVGLMDQGRYGAAEPLLRQALQDLRRLEGVETLTTAAIEGNLAILLYRRGDCDEAEALYRRALATARRLHGEDHPQVSANKSNLATCLRDQGRYEEAERLYREVLATYREQLGEEHPANAPVVHNLGVLMLLRGDLAGAEPLLLDALASERRFMGEDHPTYALHRLSQARLLLAKGDAVAAEAIARAALEVLRRRMSAEHWQTHRAQSVLGASLMRQGRFEEAEPLLTGSYLWLADRLSPRAVAAREARERVIELYDAWGRPRKAAEYRAPQTAPATRLPDHQR